MARLALAFLGPLQVTLDGTPVTAFESDKVRALLVYLAVEADRPHRRAALAGLLWPERPERAAHLNLNQAVSNLRQALHDRTATPPLLQITPESIQFNLAGDDTLDVAMFAALLDACAQHPHRHPETCPACLRRLHRAIVLYRGDFLAQFFLRDATAFEEWALLTRERLRRRALGALAHLATAAERHGDHEQVQSYAWRQLELEPWREAAHRQVMRALALSGQRTAALAHYEHCRDTLQADLGVEPAEETTTLYQEIRDEMLLQPAGPRSRVLNMPAAATPFIGRDAERTVLVQQLSERSCRLLTLVGPPGIGKTRLSLAVTTELAADFMDGAVVVQLAPLRDPEQVILAIATTLQLQETGSEAVLDRVSHYLCEKQMLLVLDNFEHVLGAAAVVGRLLATAPNLVVLVTSRAVLHLAAEQTFPVPPLSLPPLIQPALVAQIATTDAVQLFVARAQAVQPEFSLTASNAGTVAAICQRVEGVPLALELAAARLRMFGPQALLARLSNRLRFLTGGPTDGEARQRTVAAAIDWSYQLLSPVEQALFRRAAVFVGGWSLEASATVCGLPAEVVLDGIQSLLDKSLLYRTDGDAGQPRFTMLEMMRDYAQEQLVAQGEAAVCQQHHAAYYLALAEVAEPELRGPDQEVWFTRLAQEHENLRAALDWYVADHDVEAALRLGAALTWFWYVRGYQSEGRWRFVELLGHAGVDVARVEVGPLPRSHALARVLLGAALCFDSEVSQRHAVPRSLLSASVSLFRELNDAWALGLALGLQAVLYNDTNWAECIALLQQFDDPWSVAFVHLCQSLAFVSRGDMATARVQVEQGLRAFRELGDRWGIALALRQRGTIAAGQGDGDVEFHSIEESVKLRRETGDRGGLAASLQQWADALRWHGDYERAAATYDECIALYRDLGFTFGLACALHGRGYVAVWQGEAVLARRLLVESLRLFQGIPSRDGIGWCLHALAGHASQAGVDVGRRAVRLLGAAENLTRPVTDWQPGPRAEYDRVVVAARAQIDTTGWEAAWAEGMAMTLEQAISYALEDTACS